MVSQGFPISSLLVAAGGGLGAWLRYVTGWLWTGGTGPVAPSGFPWATLTCNLLGSVAMGVLAGWLVRHGSQYDPWRLLLGVGVLGGYTTFSAFSLELALLVERGAIGMATLYAGVSLGGGVIGLFSGLMLMRMAA